MENVTASFEPTSFSVTVRGLKSTPLQFSVSKLHKDINPEGSTIKIMKTKILVKLKKVLDGMHSMCWETKLFCTWPRRTA